MPDELKAKQEEKAVTQAIKFLKKRGYAVSWPRVVLLALQKNFLLQGLFVMEIFLYLLFLILSR